MSTFFDELLESVQQMDEVVKGERAPSREFHVDATQVKVIRKATGLTQVQFAQCIGIEVATLRNWEKLNTKATDRLTIRANKRKSKKRVLPVEYISNKENISFIQGVLDYIDEHNIAIMSAIFSLGISLLKRNGIYHKQHVAFVLYTNLFVINLNLQLLHLFLYLLLLVHTIMGMCRYLHL